MTLKHINIYLRFKYSFTIKAPFFPREAVSKGLEVW